MTGIVAAFDSREALLRAMAGAKAEHSTIVTAFSPAYDVEILAAADVPRSAVPSWTLAAGVMGAILGLVLTVMTVRRWPTLMLGGKPLIAVPPFLIIAVELTILFAVCATMAGFFVAGRRMQRTARTAYDPSLSGERFGVIVACPSNRASAMGELMTRHGAVTWRVV